MKLTPDEAHEIIGIIDSTLERLIFLNILTPDILTHKEELAHLQGIEISRIIEEQHQLEKRYEELVAHRTQLRALSNKSKFKEKQHEIEDVARELRYATKNLCRNLKDNPNVGANLLKIERERIVLYETLKQAREELTNYEFPTLTSHIETERQRNELLRATIAKEREASAEIVRTKDELRDEAELRDREKTIQSEEIATAKEDLQELKAKTAIDRKYMLKEVRAHAECAKRVFHTRESKMDDAISRAQTALDLESQANADSVAFLEAKHEQLQEEIQTWISKYDQDIEEKERELETLKTNKANNLVRLYDLREKYREVDAEVTREKKRIESERLQRELEVKKVQSAILIQKTWRKYQAGKVLVAKKKALIKAQKAATKKKKKEDKKKPGSARSPARSSSPKKK